MVDNTMSNQITANQTEEAFQALFNVVKNKENWKNATTPFSTKSEKLAEIMGSVLTFYTGGFEVVVKEGRWTVTSEGYYHYIGA